jgi:two-component system, OmpR family, sensor histidine kinase CiaH
MWQVALGENLNRHRLNFFKHSDHRSDYSSVRINAEGEIVEKQLHKQISNETLKKLVDMAIKTDNESGEIELDQNNDYIFLKVIVDRTQGFTMVFIDSTRKKEIFNSLVFQIIFIVFVSLLLVLIGSLFLSGKTLIPIKKAWQKQIDFSADASHELRTPLSVIQTNLELVMGNPNETVKSQINWLENILVENKRMTRLVDDLLTLSRTDSNQQILDKTHFIFDEALKEVIVPLEPLAAN